MFEYMSAIDVPPRSLDPIANTVIKRFNEAVAWQQAGERIGGKSLRQVLTECYEQYNGILSPSDQEIANAVGVNAYVNICASKCDLVHEYLAESIVQNGDIPWVVNPTPLPTLSARGQEEALSLVKEQIFGQQFSGELLPMMRQIKELMRSKELEVAEAAASAMEVLMRDQCIEGKWNQAMNAFLTDFTVYPYAVIHGPVPTRRPRLAWSKDKARAKLETYYEFRHVSPWDFWWSPDSPDTQRGSGVFIRQRWTRRMLLDAVNMNSYIKSNVESVLDNSERTGFNYKWLSPNPDQLDDHLIAWAQCTGTVDALVYYGRFKGSELQEYGITGLEALEDYEAAVTLVGGLTIQVCVTNNPIINMRPVFTSSFYKTHDRISNYGISQRLRDVERVYMALLRYFVMNASNASAPTTEVDVQRVIRYAGNGIMTQYMPGMTFFSDSEMNNNNPAYRFYMPPNNMNYFMQALSFCMDLADRITNVPAALHGYAQGTGANRTFRGAAMYQGNAVKAITGAGYNIDESVFGPMGQLLFSYNMLFEKDDMIKGDSQVNVQGAAGMLQREIDRQNAYELLQVAAQLGNVIPPQTLQFAVSNVFTQMGVPKEYNPKVSYNLQAVSGPTGEQAAPTEQPGMEMVA